MKAPIFILGTQRSGTTLLTRALSAHPKIFIKNELSVQRIFTHGCTKSSILESIKTQISESYDLPIHELLQKENKATWGLKDPELTNYIPLLEQFIPESKFIIIIRDGRGVVNSYKHNKWGLGTNAYTGTLRWIREVEEQLAFLKKHPKNVIMIRYEDLVTDMEQSLIKVCEHIEEDFHPAMLDYSKNKQYIKRTRENIHTEKAPDIELSKKWRRELSEKEINIIETIASDLLEQLGYNAVGSKVHLSKATKLYYVLHQRIIGELQLQYRWRKSQMTSLLRNRKNKKTGSSQ